MTRKRLFVLCIAAVAALAVAASALAAHPTKGGAYVGVLTPSAGLEKRVVLKVSKDGKTAGARLQCASTRIGSFQRFKISRTGRFTAYRKTGSFVTARLRGRFSSKTTAHANLYLPAACDGVGGRMTLLLK
jgi:hypothetical protein